PRYMNLSATRCASDLIDWLFDGEYRELHAIIVCIEAVTKVRPSSKLKLTADRDSRNSWCTARAPATPQTDGRAGNRLPRAPIQCTGGTHTASTPRPHRSPRFPIATPPTAFRLQPR